MPEISNRLQTAANRPSLPVTPHLPGGYATPQQLHNIATTAATYGGTLKITTGSISILGLNLVDGKKILEELGLVPESFSVKGVRGVIMCPGNPHCPMAKQSSTELGLALDKKFFGQSLPAKLRIGISACPNCCAEVFVKDIGLYGTATGYILVAGGNSGRKAKAAQVIAEQVPTEQVIPIIENILDYYQKLGEPKERLGQTLDRTGWNKFMEAVIPSGCKPLAESLDKNNKKEAD